jgi:hypothetical protein
MTLVCWQAHLQTLMMGRLLLRRPFSVTVLTGIELRLVL